MESDTKLSPYTKYLHATISDIAGEWNNDQLHEAFMILVSAIKDEDLEEWFEDHLKEYGFKFDK